MKAEALALVGEETNPSRILNILREYLQVLALRSLHESEAFSNLAFVGGTALRFSHGLLRFSEDLDFSLEALTGYLPERWLKKLKTDLMLAGYDITLSWSDKTDVHKSWIKYGELLKEAGLSPHSEQKLSIKLEIDTRPPHGAVCNRRIITRHRLLSLQLYDLPSLMAGKIHALISRGYPKGRDWYDLLWYRGRRPPVEPNLTQLQNALDQTHGKGAFHASDWKARCLERAQEIDIAKLVLDVHPFLEHPEEAAMLTFDNIRSVLLDEV